MRCHSLCLAVLFTGEPIVMSTSERHCTRFPQLSIWMSACVLDGPDQCVMAGPKILRISIRETTKMAITFHQILAWGHCGQNSSSVRHRTGARRWDHHIIAIPSNRRAPTDRMVHRAERGQLSRDCHLNLGAKAAMVLDQRLIE